MSSTYLSIDQPFPTATPSQTPVPSPTPSPTVTPTPAPGGATAVVTGTGGVGLRCRTGPSTGASVIMTLAEGTTVNVIGVTTAGWTPVSCGGRDGWASSTYLRISQDGPTATAVPESTGVIANTGGDRVNCRATASLAGTVITRLTEGTIVTLRGPATGDWQPVRCGDRDGFIWAEYVEIGTSLRAASVDLDETATTEATETGQSTLPATPVPTEIPATTVPTEIEPEPTAEPTVVETPVPVTGYAYIASDTGAPINCRAAPSTDASILTVVAHGEEIALRGEPVDGWQGVVCNGEYGYVAASFISATPPPTPTEPEVVDQPQPPPDEPDPAEESPAYPDGSNPWFDGAPLPVVDAWSENGATSAWNAVDGSTGTAWSSTNGAWQASLTLDLGAAYDISGIRWTLAEAGFADSLTIQVSVDGGSWITLDTYGNRTPFTWEGVPAGISARYVRIVADNPNGDPFMGRIAEVEIWGTASSSGVAIALQDRYAVPPRQQRTRRGRSRIPGKGATQ
jgi:uncharacterized protein YraI